MMNRCSPHMMDVVYKWTRDPSRFGISTLNS